MKPWCIRPLYTPKVLVLAGARTLVYANLREDTLIATSPGEHRADIVMFSSSYHMSSHTINVNYHQLIKYRRRVISLHTCTKLLCLGKWTHGTVMMDRVLYYTTEYTCRLYTHQFSRIVNPICYMRGLNWHAPCSNVNETTYVHVRVVYQKLRPYSRFVASWRTW